MTGDIVAEIIDAGRLAAADVLAVAQRDDDHVDGVEHIARNPERLGELAAPRSRCRATSGHQ